MQTTKFHCGDIIRLTNFNRYSPDIECDYAGKELPIVAVHPVNIHGEMDFTDDDIQFFVPAINHDILNYIAFVGADIEKVGSIEYRPIFGKFTYGELLELLESPRNPVELYMFTQCHRALDRYLNGRKPKKKEVLYVRNTVSESNDYYTGISVTGCMKITNK